MKKIKVLVLSLLFLVGCAYNKEIRVGLYHCGDMTMEIIHNGEMGVKYDFGNYGGLTNYDYIRDDIYYIYLVNEEDEQDSRQHVMAVRGNVIFIYEEAALRENSLNKLTVKYKCQ